MGYWDYFGGIVVRVILHSAYSNDASEPSIGTDEVL